MSLATVLTGAASGALAGGALWQWLRGGQYRIADDEPRLELTRAWVVIPAATAAGGLAGLAFQGWLALSVWTYLVGAIALVWIDLDVHRVPDLLLRWWAPAIVALVLIAAVVEGQWAIAGTAVGGAGAMGLLFLALALGGSMGLGDVKLAAVTGLVLGALGWGAVVTGVVIAFAAGAIAGILLLARGASRTTHLAFGPAIIVGAAAAIARVGTS